MNPDHPDFVSGLYEVKNLEYTSQVLVSFLVSWSHELQRILDSDKGLRPALAHLHRRPNAHLQTLDQTGRLLDLFDEVGLASTDLASSISRQLCNRIADWRKEVDKLGELGLRYREAVADRDAKEKVLAKRVKKEHQKKGSWWPKASSSSKSSAKTSAQAEGEGAPEKAKASSDEAAHDYLQACELVEQLRAQFDDEMEEVVRARSAISIDGLRAVGGCVSEFAAHLDHSSQRYANAFPSLSSHLATHRSVRGGLGDVPEPLRTLHASGSRNSVDEAAVSAMVQVDEAKRPETEEWAADFPEENAENEESSPAAANATAVEPDSHEQEQEVQEEEQEEEKQEEAAVQPEEDFEDFEGTDFVAAPTPEASEPQLEEVEVEVEPEQQQPEPPQEDEQADEAVAEEEAAVEVDVEVEITANSQEAQHAEPALQSKESSKASVGPAHAKNPFTSDVESECRLNDREVSGLSDVEFKAPRDAVQQVFTSSPAERDRDVPAAALPSDASKDSTGRRENTTGSGQAQLLQPKILPLEPQNLPGRENSDRSWGDADSIGFQSCPSITSGFQSCPSIRTEESMGPAE